jgi:hypothetical protein
VGITPGRNAIRVPGFWITNSCWRRSFRSIRLPGRHTVILAYIKHYRLKVSRQVETGLPD